MKRSLAFAVVLVSFLLACSEKPKVVHHFEPMANTQGSLAMDTATGKMCRTWAWVCSEPTIRNPWTGKTVENSMYGIKCRSIEELPTCDQLLKADSADQQIPVQPSPGVSPQGSI